MQLLLHEQPIGEPACLFHLPKAQPCPSSCKLPCGIKGRNIQVLTNVGLCTCQRRRKSSFLYSSQFLLCCLRYPMSLCRRDNFTQLLDDSTSPASSTGFFSSWRCWRTFPVYCRLDPQVTGRQLPIYEGHRPVSPRPSPQAVLEGNQVENMFCAEVDPSSHV